MHDKKYIQDANIPEYKRVPVQRAMSQAYLMAKDKKILPSMRSMQFAGQAIELNNTRMFNCAYLPLSEFEGFSEALYLLLGGTGVGYSVQRHHIRQLPTLPKIGRDADKVCFQIPDSIEGWADAVAFLFKWTARGKRVTFDYSLIRPKGALLKTAGGKAPGPAPLKRALDATTQVLHRVGEAGGTIHPIHAHDIMCILADCVVAGGIRRSALIALFSRDDSEMLTCKTGAWWVNDPQRARANNSVVLPRGEVSEQEFKALLKTVQDSGAGEPGIYWTNDIEWGTNPCCEIALRPYSFCNLVEVNVHDVSTQDDLEQRVVGASTIGTLQAGYTDFPYLRPIWKRTSEEDALVGVGLTGLGSGASLDLDFTRASEVARKTNELVSGLIGINRAKRVTTIKPSGTSSLILGCSSGIHAWHSEYYLRRVRYADSEPIVPFLRERIPAFVEPDRLVPGGSVVSFPIKAPAGCITRDEGARHLLLRVGELSASWIRGGHVEGVNHNNISVTVSVKPEEWDMVAEWMWENRDTYNGIALLPYDGGTYPQAPFEEITKEEYDALLPIFQDFDITELTEDDDNTNLVGEAACAGGTCELF